MAYEKYFLDDTPSGHARLAILNSLYNENTLDALSAAELGEGMSVLEVGSGAGILTAGLAKLVGPSGRVVTVDRSAEQIKALSSAGLPSNVEARHLALSELDELGEQFDFVYARWILLHLTDTFAGVTALSRRVGAGGTLAIEDCVTRTAFCHPATPAFGHFIDGWLAVSKHTDIAPDAGDELLRLVDQAGFSPQTLRHYQPLLVSNEERMLPAMCLAETKDAHVKCGVFSDAEVDAIVKDLKSLGGGHQTMGFVRNTFVAGKARG